jgi:20S proteasome subunit alpha 6
MLIGAIDEAGTHLFETCPSGNYFEYHAMAIGDRCQSAKTYLEKHFESFSNLNVDQLIRHGIEALRASAQDTDLSEHNVTIGVLGKDMPFKMLSKEELRPLLGQENVEMV